MTTGFGVVLALMLVVVALSAWHLSSIQQAADRVSREEWPRLLALQALAAHAQGHGAAMARLLTARREQREAIYPALDAESAAMDRLLTDLQRRFDEPVALAQVRDLDAARRRYREVFAEVGVWIESGEPARAAELFSAEGQPALDRLVAIADRLASAQQTAVESWQDQAAQRVTGAEQQLATLALLALIGAAVLSWRIGLGVTLPMAGLAATARRLASGDGDARVQSPPGQGLREIVHVSHALNDMADAIAERNARIERIAFTDAVTGLPNRAGLERAARTAPVTSHPPDGILLLDVARLSAVNDVLGSAAGDTLLHTLGQRLRAFVEGTPLQAGHLGGGTFAIVLRGPADATAVDEALRTDLIRALSGPVACDGLRLDVHFTCGWSAAAPGDAGQDLTRRLREAEEALAGAKRVRASVQRFERSDPAQRRRQLSLLGSLRQAAESGDLQMWLQPKWRLTAHGPGVASPVAGFEALVRWSHPEWGLVSPAEFVPFAERAGMVGVITRCMIEQALRFLASAPVEEPDLRVSVNVSTADLLEADFVGWMLDRARALQAPLSRLTLEITESRLMDDAARARPVMAALRDAGLQWSIDDFGTGYSSLAYLQQLPVSELKIDRSFVDGVDRSPARGTLLRSIVQMGHGLGLHVTAEGVERNEELALLQRVGCDLAQGWLIAKPMPVPAALQWLERQGIGDAPVHAVVARPALAED